MSTNEKTTSDFEINCIEFSCRVNDKKLVVSGKTFREFFLFVIFVKEMRTVNALLSLIVQVPSHMSLQCLHTVLILQGKCISRTKHLLK